LIVYFDTSALVPVVIEEPASQAASRLWDAADRVVSSRLVYPEGRAALAMAFRLERIGARGLRSAVAQFERLHAQLDIVDTTGEIARSAGVLAQQFGLRGYDAVHLASARAVGDSELVLAAGDRALVTAARTLGVATANLTAMP
jgi:predicted nucleic acid-binding protein